jgi:SAM-dependent methyltransferase
LPHNFATMPAPAAARQPERSAPGWFSAASARHLLRLEQRHALPLIATCFGRTGLYLRCEESAPAELSGNMLQRVMCLFRAGRQLHGDLVCAEHELPLLRESVELVVLLHALEGASDPRLILGEVERVLAPEGSVIVLGLNPYSLWRARWLGTGLRSTGAGRCRGLLREAGLEAVRLTGVGPVLPWVRASDRRIADRDARFDPFAVWRASYLIHARKRRAGLTPLRARSGNVSFEPGIRAG